MTQPNDSKLSHSQVDTSIGNGPTDAKTIDQAHDEANHYDRFSGRLSALEAQGLRGTRFALVGGLVVGLTVGISATLLGTKYTQTPPPQKQEFDYTAFETSLNDKLQNKIDAVIRENATAQTAFTRRVDEKFDTLPSHYTQLEHRVDDLNTLVGGQANQIGAHATTLADYIRRLGLLENMPLQDPRLADTAFVTSLASIVARAKTSGRPSTPQPEEQDPSLPALPRPEPRTDIPKPTDTTRDLSIVSPAYLRERNAIVNENQGNPIRLRAQLTDLDNRYGVHR